MKAIVQPSVCQGHTLCNMVAPEIFQLQDDDGHAFVVGDVVPEDQQAAARAAAATCPEGAIELE